MFTTSAAYRDQKQCQVISSPILQREARRVATVDDITPAEMDTYDPANKRASFGGELWNMSAREYMARTIIRSA